MLPGEIWRITDWGYKDDSPAQQRRYKLSHAGKLIRREKYNLIAVHRETGNDLGIFHYYFWTIEGKPRRYYTRMKGVLVK